MENDKDTASDPHLSRTSGISTIIVIFTMAVALLAGCSTLTAPPPKVASATEPRPRKAAAAESATTPSVSYPNTAPAFYAELTPRLAAFLREMSMQLVEGNWKWIQEHSEKAYYRTLVSADRYDHPGYLRYLFRIGMDYKGKFPNVAIPADYFPATQIRHVQYIQAVSDNFMTTVYGYVFDSRGHRLDFAVDALDRIEPILLSGAYP